MDNFGQSMGKMLFGTPTRTKTVKQTHTQYVEVVDHEKYIDRVSYNKINNLLEAKKQELTFTRALIACLKIEFLSLELFHSYLEELRKKGKDLSDDEISSLRADAEKEILAHNEKYSDFFLIYKEEGEEALQDMYAPLLSLYDKLGALGIPFDSQKALDKNYLASLLPPEQQELNND